MPTIQVLRRCVRAARSAFQPRAGRRRRVPGRRQLVLSRGGAARGDLRARPTSSCPALHNVANVLAACAIASAAGIGVEAMRAAVPRAFKGVPHRLEMVAELDGVRYVDDSIATAPERSMAGLAALRGTPLVLLAGGRDKHLPMDEWGRDDRESSARRWSLLGEMASTM